ncbi:hypothetical protein N7455_012583 [Penicillium solitum]|uniref:uncharacterized protein n=1 Tax=Penicillium solitum TaxID=60172 RepID=UPI0032C48F65|nr:hypothetical protein N7455_012583 [Penicillium solitum]
MSRYCFERRPYQIRLNATDEEVFYLIWCYTLNRHYAFKSRKLRCSLVVQLPSNLCDLYPTCPPISELLLI